MGVQVSLPQSWPTHASRSDLEGIWGLLPVHKEDLQGPVAEVEGTYPSP